MPATLNAPLSHRIIRRLSRGLFRLIGLFQAQDNTDEDNLPREIRVILRILKLAQGDALPPPGKMRKLYRLLTMPYHVSAPPMSEVRGFTVPDGPTVRLYRPQGTAAPAPALVYFHGGGGVIGDLESHDPLCRYLAAKAGMVVVAVDYRLGPEHKFPAQIDDARAAFHWVRQNTENLGINAARIGAGGDSAGAYLALLLAQELQAGGGGESGDSSGPDFLWLVYPFADLALDTASRRQFTKGLILTTPVVDYFKSQTEGGEKLPSLANEDFTTCPPTLIVTVGFDPLRDEGMALAARMEATGAVVHHLHYPRLLHEFISMGGVVPEARAALDEAIDGLKALAKA